MLLLEHGAREVLVLLRDGLIHRRPEIGSDSLRWDGRGRRGGGGGGGAAHFSLK